MANKIIRNCIICGADDPKPLFSFTWDFLTKVRWSPPEELRAYGWDEETTSTVVKCCRCGCCYTRDVVPYPDAEAVNQLLAEHDEPAAEPESARQYVKIDNTMWTVRNLILLAAKRQRRSIRFLDFGAGAGTICNIARALGVGTVVAYDPFSPPGASTYRDRNFPGIIHARALQRLEELGAFDAVVCQSVIEHVLDPRQELATMHRLMSPGGLLYINNPHMPIDQDIAKLRAAEKISKRDLISYYHQHHFNYMGQRHFERLVREVGFRVTPLAYFPPMPFAPATRKQWLLNNLKSVYRGLQNSLRIDYGRQFYILERL